MDYGLSRAGFDHAFFCESDEWRRRVLAHHWPGVPIYDDVRTVAVGEPAGRAAADGLRPPDHGWGREAGAGIPGGLDLLCGGFPCQDLSVAGNRAGLAGNRSGLFFEFARIIDALRPRWVLVENVPGLLSSNGGRDFGVVLGTLADVGYGVGWRVLDSRFFGVPQRRRRVFILATESFGDPRGAAERAGEILAVGSRCTGHFEASGEAGPDVAVASISGLGNGGPDDNDGQAGRLVTAVSLTSGGHPNSNMPGRRKEDDVNLVAAPLRSHPRPGSNSNGAMVGVRRLTPTECERLQALPDGWTDHGPDSRRYSALGDAVTSSVSEWIGRRLLAHITQEVAA